MFNKIFRGFSGKGIETVGELSIQQIIVEHMIAITKENAQFIMKIMEKKVWLANDLDFKRLLENQVNPKASKDGTLFFNRVDDPENPFLTNEKRTRVYVWRRCEKGKMESEVDPRSLVVLYADRVGNEQMTLTFLPSSLRSGGVPFAMIYRMSCCTGLSAFVSVSVGEKDYFSVIHSVAGVEASMSGAGCVFRDVGVAKNSESLRDLLHAYRDVAQIRCQCSHNNELQTPKVG